MTNVTKNMTNMANVANMTRNMTNMINTYCLLTGRCFLSIIYYKCYNRNILFTFSGKLFFL